jgi:hypothetical protein
MLLMPIAKYAVEAERQALQAMTASGKNTAVQAAVAVATLCNNPSNQLDVSYI